MERILIADEIDADAALNELACRDLMPSMMAGLLTRGSGGDAIE